MQPTIEQYNAYQGLFQHFNHHLFGGELPGVLLNFSRKKGAAGFFAARRWVKKDGLTEIHEISINPESMEQGLEYICDTLVHEQCHLWQEVHGTPPRKCYHDREWADKMESVWLMPSTTGLPGGARTGQRMSDYPIAGGRFLQAFALLTEADKLPFMAKKMPEDLSSSQQKTKYTCKGCKTNVWGKDGLQIICGPCNERFVRG